MTVQQYLVLQGHELLSILKLRYICLLQRLQHYICLSLLSIYLAFIGVLFVFCLLSSICELIVFIVHITHIDLLCASITVFGLCMSSSRYALGVSPRSESWKNKLITWLTLGGSSCHHLQGAWAYCGSFTTDLSLYYGYIMLYQWRRNQLKSGTAQQRAPPLPSPAAKWPPEPS